jgi:hypothetical protein
MATVMAAELQRPPLLGEIFDGLLEGDSRAKGVRTQGRPEWPPPFAPAPPTKQ